MAMKFVERENEILRMIESFSDAALEFIVVGGYAVSGLARHRFSVDLDVVIQRKNLDAFLRILKEKGFEKYVQRTGFDEVYGGEFVSCVKKINDLPVTVDLLVESLVCRTTKASWSFDYIKRYLVIADVAGVAISVKCRIPENELLIAFKIHSGRRTDVRDFVLLAQDADIEKIIKHIKRGDLGQLRIQVRSMIEMLKDKRLVDSLKGVFSISYDVSEQIENAQKILEEINTKLIT
nr:hypothetical protein [Candidatus Freyarchaeota archaeon]